MLKLLNEKPTKLKLIDTLNNELEKGFFEATKLSLEMNNKNISNFSNRHFIHFNVLKNNLNEKLNSFLNIFRNIINNLQIEKFDQLTKKDQLKLGFAYFTLGDFKNSFLIFLKLNNFISKFENSIFWYCLGICYHHFNYFDSSLECFDIVEKLTVNNKFKEEFLFRLSILYRDKGLYEKSLEILLLLKENNNKILTNDDIDFQISYIYQLKLEYNKSIEIIKNLIIKYNQCNYLHLYYFWLLYLSNKDYYFLNNISLSYSKYFSNDPYFNLISGRINLKLKNTMKAYENLLKCKEFFGYSSNYWATLGLCFFQNSQYSDSLTSFQRSIKLDPSNFISWLNLGLISEINFSKKNAIDIYLYAKKNEKINNPLIDKRLLDFENNKSHGPLDIIDIDDLKLFIEFPKQYTDSFINSTPFITSFEFGLDDTFDDLLFNLYPPSLLLLK